MKYVMIVLMGLGLGACATSPMSEPDMKQTVLDSAADEIILASTPEERATRACFFVVWNMERWAMAARYGYADAEEIAETYTAALKMRAAVGHVRQALDGPWFNTDVAYMLIDIGKAGGAVVTLTIEQYAGLFLTGNWSGLIDKVEQAGAEALLTRYMILDVQALYAKLETGEIALSEVWVACARRGQGNIEVLETYMGLN